MKPKRILVLLFFAASVVAAPRPKNIILVIGDGMGPSHVTAARWIRGDKLQLLRMPVIGIVATHSADDAVTDSAASASAYATGMKTNNGALSVDADGNPRRTVLEVANESGRATGIVTTTDVWDATPAAFLSHAKNRYSDARSIVQQIVSGKADVILGGGSDLLGKGNFPSLAELKQGDRAVVTSRAELEGTKARRVLGLFNTQPNDTEDPNAPLWMLAKWAIASLSADPDGFFLLIENEGIDTSSHNKNSADVAKALAEYDEALRVALDLAAARRDTLVIAVGDHETGGLDICCEGGEEKGWHMEWSTPDHTGAAIPLFAFGPGSESFSGYIDNTDVGRKLLSFVRKSLSRSAAITPQNRSEVRLQSKACQLVRELAIERRHGVVSVRAGDGDDGSVSEAREGIGPKLQHALPRTVIDDLHAGKPGDRIDDGRSLPCGQPVLALQDVHDFEDDGLQDDAGDRSFFGGVEKGERGFLLSLVSFNEE